MPTNLIASDIDIPGVPAPLVIGITGHRDLREQDRGELENAVSEVFFGFKQQYPSIPLVLLSPLAEGADRLVAHVALRPEIGAHLVVPLPMPAALYETDFEAPSSRAEFDNLLSLADRWFVLPTADEAGILTPGPARNKQYENVGKYIVHKSQILIALWDGVESNKVGGTAQIVKFKIEGTLDRDECALNPPGLFPVYHIVTPRQSNPNPAGQPFTLRVIQRPSPAVQ